MQSFTDLLIDIDGTLTDTKEVERQALKKLFELYDIKFSNDLINKYSQINESLWLEFEKGKITKDVLRIKRFEILFKDIENKLNIIKFAKEYFKLYSKTVIETKNAVYTIMLLFKKYNLHIISNGSTDVQYYKLEKMGIKDCFKNIFLSEEIGYAKPDQRFFDFVYDNIKQKNKEKVAVIGDSISADIKGGKQFGFKTIYVGNEKTNCANYSIKSFDEISNIL